MIKATIVETLDQKIENLDPKIGTIETDVTLTGITIITEAINTTVEAEIILDETIRIEMTAKVDKGLIVSNQQALLDGLHLIKPKTNPKIETKTLIKKIKPTKRKDRRPHNQ